MGNNYSCNGHVVCIACLVSGETRLCARINSSHSVLFSKLSFAEKLLCDTESCKHHYKLHFGIPCAHDVHDYHVHFNGAPGQHPQLPMVIDTLLNLDLTGNLDGELASKWGAMNLQDRKQHLRAVLNDVEHFDTDHLPFLRKMDKTASVVPQSDCNNNELMKDNEGDSFEHYVPINRSFFDFVEVLRSLSQSQSLIQEIINFAKTLMSNSAMQRQLSVQPTVVSDFLKTADDLLAFTRKLFSLIVREPSSGSLTPTLTSVCALDASAGGPWIEIITNGGPILLFDKWARLLEVGIGSLFAHTADFFGDQWQDNPVVGAVVDLMQKIIQSPRAKAEEILSRVHRPDLYVAGMRCRITPRSETGKQGTLYDVAAGDILLALKKQRLKPTTDAPSLSRQFSELHHPETNSFYGAYIFSVLKEIKELNEMKPLENMDERMTRIAAASARIVRSLSRLLPISSWISEEICEGSKMMTLNTLMIRYPENLQTFLANVKKQIQDSSLDQDITMRNAWRLLCAQVIHDVCVQLSDLHASGIAHHDLHWGNVLVFTENETVEFVLADFGSSARMFTAGDVMRTEVSNGVEESESNDESRGTTDAAYLGTCT